MHIAVASSQGKSIDLHFGQTESFLIYSKGKDSLILEDRKQVTPLSNGEPNHAFDKERFERIVEALAGCSKVYCAKIGDKPQEELAKRGIKAVIFSGDIKDISM